MKGNKAKRQQAKQAVNACGMLDYLQSVLPTDTLLQLYLDDSRGRFVCRAVLQQLSCVAQQIVVRLSCCGGVFPYKDIKVWVTAGYDSSNSSSNNNTGTDSIVESRLREILEELQQWSLLNPEQSYPINDKSDKVALTAEFAKGLRESLSSLDTSPWTPLTLQEIRDMEKEAMELYVKEKSTKRPPREAKPVTVEDLERYTQAQWDAVLHFLVGTPNLSIKPAPAVVAFLEETELMQADPDFHGPIDRAPLVITQKGYDFMLQDNHEQVWHFIVQYLKSLTQQVAVEKKAKRLEKEALLLLVCLGFARVGEPYSTASLTKKGRVMVEDLALFGLLLVRKIGANTIFYPTRVALQLVGLGDNASKKKKGSGGGGGGNALWTLSSKALTEALSHPTPQGSSHLAIIVLTNFQLCAYTTSELHISMLGLFCDLQTIRRLPNIVFMVLTRDSIKAAFSLGIQAKQILRFLEKHAHPKLRVTSDKGGTSNVAAGGSPVPSNVIDQIWLWDRERHRVKWAEVYSHQCTMIEAGEFYAVAQYAKDHGAHAWSSEEKKQLLIYYSQAEKVQNFARRWRAKTVARQAEADGL